MTYLERQFRKLRLKGYRVKTSGDRVAITALGNHATIFIAVEELEIVMRQLLGKEHERLGKPTKRKAFRKFVRKKLRNGQTKSQHRKGARAVSSVYRNRGKGSGAGPSQGGLPGLGRRR